MSRTAAPNDPQLSFALITAYRQDVAEVFSDLLQEASVSADNAQLQIRCLLQILDQTLNVLTANSLVTANALISLMASLHANAVLTLHPREE